MHKNHINCVADCIAFDCILNVLPLCIQSKCLLLGIDILNYLLHLVLVVPHLWHHAFLQAKKVQQALIRKLKIENSWISDNWDYFIKFEGYALFFNLPRN
jgi:hypothetical protein